SNISSDKKDEMEMQAEADIRDEIEAQDEVESTSESETQDELEIQDGLEMQDELEIENEFEMQDGLEMDNLIEENYSEKDISNDKNMDEDLIIDESVDINQIPNNTFYFENSTSTLLFCWIQKHNISTSAYNNLVYILQSLAFNTNDVVKDVRKLWKLRNRLPLIPIRTRPIKINQMKMPSTSKVTKRILAQ
ncbi:17445_t:CDS:2, partial [Dentiscutata erythropus]